METGIKLGKSDIKQEFGKNRLNSFKSVPGSSGGSAQIPEFWGVLGDRPFKFDFGRILLKPESSKESSKEIPGRIGTNSTKFRRVPRDRHKFRGVPGSSRGYPKVVRKVVRKFRGVPMDRHKFREVPGSSGGSAQIPQSSREFWGISRSNSILD